MHILKSPCAHLRIYLVRDAYSTLHCAERPALCLPHVRTYYAGTWCLQGQYQVPIMLVHGVYRDSTKYLLCWYMVSTGTVPSTYYAGTWCLQGCVDLVHDV